jgi:putative transposase
VPGTPWHIIQRGNNRSACFVAHPHDYRWSSYRYNAEGKANPLIKSHDEYERLGMTPTEQRAAYRQLFSAHIDPEHIAEIRAATNGNNCWAMIDSRKRSVACLSGG